MSVNSVTELIFGLIGGSALLMYGVELMGSGLEKAAGTYIKKIMSVLTGKTLSAFFVGTAVTALVQSSTVVTVITVGLVNAGLMGLKQAVGVIYGANIGTTVTAQLMAFDITSIALPVLGLGYIMMSFPKKQFIKSIGQGILGFGMLFLGMKLLTMGVPYLRTSEDVINFFHAYGNNTLVSLAIGTLVTIVVQSSSAVMGITMVLSKSGFISIYGAIGFMLGSNIGTCATAQIAAIAGNTTAKRTAWAHTLYNIVGASAVLIAFEPFLKLVSVISPNIPIERQIANSHTIFNIISALIFLPLTNFYVKFIESIVPDKRSIM